MKGTALDQPSGEHRGTAERQCLPYLQVDRAIAGLTGCRRQGVLCLLENRSHSTYHTENKKRGRGAQRHADRNAFAEDKEERVFGGVDSNATKASEYGTLRTVDEAEQPAVGNEGRALIGLQ
eukprot:SAG22_NODE_2991_length_2044_cov_1.840617_2_plen_122_part_00